MTNKRISDLTAATTPLAGTELVPVWDGATTKQVSVTNLTAGRAVAGTQFTASTGDFVPATSGKGVNFSAVTPAAGMTSQLLNWYEEGTWTPNDGSGAGLVFSAATGRYTRIGRMVTVVFNVVYPSTISASAARIGGLPFTANATANGFSAGSFNINTSTQIVQPSIVAGDTKFAALIVNAGVSATNANLSLATMQGGFSYFI